jgi:hypothetical protein
MMPELSGIIKQGDEEKKFCIQTIKNVFTGNLKNLQQKKESIKIINKRAEK